MAKPVKPAQAFDEGTPIDIEMTPVDSSQIKSIGHDAKTNTLAVVFKYGKALYQYPNVERTTFDAFLKADSAGTFFGQNIKELPFKKYHLPESLAA